MDSNVFTGFKQEHFFTLIYDFIIASAAIKAANFSVLWSICNPAQGLIFSRLFPLTVSVQPKSPKLTVSLWASPSHLAALWALADSRCGRSVPRRGPKSALGSSRVLMVCVTHRAPVRRTTS